MANANTLSGAEGYSLSVMLAQGRAAEAEKLLAAYNRIQVAFGHSPFAMPAPHGPMNGLVTAPATGARA